MTTTIELTGMVPLACPHCGARLDCFIDLDAAGDRPGPGDWTACGTCLGVLVIGEGGTPRRPTAEEYLDLSPDERAEMARVLATVRDVLARLGAAPPMAVALDGNPRRDKI